MRRKGSRKRKSSSVVVIVILLFLILLGVGLNFIGRRDLRISINELRATNTSEEILVRVKELLNITEAPSFTLNARCDDRNPCTMDGTDQNGFCVNLIVPNGYPCISPCGISSTCQVGECVPEFCSGNCVDTVDCPDFFANDGSEDASLVSKACIAGMCVYKTNIASAMDDIDMVPEGDNSLARQLCFKSITTTGFNQTLLNVDLDFDQDGTPNALDSFTSFDTLETAQTTFPGAAITASNTIVLEAPVWLNGTVRTIGFEDPMGFFPGQEMLIDFVPGEGDNAFVVATSLPDDLTAQIEWVFPQPVSLDQLTFLSGILGGNSIELADYTISITDNANETVSVSFTPPAVSSVDWFLDLRGNPSLNISSIISIKIIVDQNGPGSIDPLIRNMHFRFSPESIAPVSACMEHVAERQPSGDILCTHYFKCSCPEPVISPVV